MKQLQLPYENVAQALFFFSYDNSRSDEICFKSNFHTNFQQGRGFFCFIDDTARLPAQPLSNIAT